MIGSEFGAADRTRLQRDVGGIDTDADLISFMQIKVQPEILSLKHAPGGLQEQRLRPLIHLQELQRTVDAEVLEPISVTNDEVLLHDVLKGFSLSDTH
jgi:hypothetical protein